MPRSLFLVLLVLSLATVAAGCGKDDNPGKTDEFGRCANFDELRQVYWGDAHIHTSLSFDANMQGTRTSPEDAYAFARGETIPLQPYEEDGTPDSDGHDRSSFGFRHAERSCGVPRHAEGLQ